MYRKRKVELNYRRTPRPEGCWFCDTKELDTLEDYPNFLLARARFPYQIWEHHIVSDHLMLVPKRHMASLSELNDTERIELLKHIGKYEDLGYNVYARPASSKRRSVGAHQHTHLIKIDNTEPKYSFYIRNPYFIFRR